MNRALLDPCYDGFFYMSRVTCGDSLEDFDLAGEFIPALIDTLSSRKDSCTMLEFSSILMCYLETYGEDKI